MITDRLFVSTREAAIMLSTSPAQVRRWVDDGTLRGERRGRKVKVVLASIRRHAGDEMPGHETVRAYPRMHQTIQEARRLHAELGKLLAEL